MADSLQLSRREALLLLPLTLAGVSTIRYATTDAFPVSLEGPIGVYSTPVDMRGKTVVITGSNPGIGYETALRLAESGATVVTLPCLYPKGRASRGAGDGCPACVIAHDVCSLHPGQVVMAGRSTQRLSDAAERIRSRVPSAMLECMHCPF